MAFEPIAPYNNYEHILNALACFVHPISGNMYGAVVEKVGGVTQNLSIYRTRPGSTHKELVKRYVGGIDSRAQIAAGGCVILQDGSLEVWASAVPITSPPVTKTGFSGVWDRIKDVDAPWGAASSGGMTMLDTPAASTAWNGRNLSGGLLVDVPAVFGVPSARAYYIRFIAQADRADIRIRAGTSAAPYFVTVCTQVANQQMHTNGPCPGPAIYVSSVDSSGQSYASQVWMQITGWAS